MPRMLAPLALLVPLLVLAPAAAATDGPFGADIDASANNGGVSVGVRSNLSRGEDDNLNGRPVRWVAPTYETMTTLGCGRTGEPDANDPGSCTFAIRACTAMGQSDARLIYIWQRPISGARPWTFAGQTCAGTSTPGLPAPPAVPSFAQIQQAFLELPFATPRVVIQPVGGVTLVNLPTYYEATWPTRGLAPGDVSKPVRLLSWTVEFRISTRSYTYSFGDGTTSGATRDPGGPYPTGGVRHTYTRTTPAAAVKVDARLTAQFRVNGGEWQDIDTVADLQGEPVTTLAVKQATSRLYTS